MPVVSEAGDTDTQVLLGTMYYGRRRREQQRALDRSWSCLVPAKPLRLSHTELAQYSPCGMIHANGDLVARLGKIHAELPVVSAFT